MHDDENSSPWSPQELEDLSQLSRESAPPELEDRVVTALDHRGLIRSPSWPRWMAMAALVVLSLAAGFTAGRFSFTPPTETEELPRFVLLLYDTPEREASRDPEQERQLAVEYGAWARQLGEQGHFVDGDPIYGESQMLRLQEDGVEALPNAVEAGGEVVVGYFMIRARNHAEAVEIAKGCPHLKYDGGVLVRQVGLT